MSAETSVEQGGVELEAEGGRAPRRAQLAHATRHGLSFNNARRTRRHSHEIPPPRDSTDQNTHAYFFFLCHNAVFLVFSPKL